MARNDPQADAPYIEMLALYADYALALEERRFEEWPGYFTENCRYEVQSRENRDLGLPGALILCDTRAMIEDRITVLRDTLTYPFLHIRHLVSNLRVHRADGESWQTTASYLVLHSTEEGETKIYSTGKYEDEIVRESDGLKFRKKIVIADTFAIDNLLAVPL